MSETGRIGLNRYGGVIREEFLPELQGVQGIKTYREMADNDDTIGAILFSIKMLVRHADWKVEPSGDSAADKEAAEFVESCMNDMSMTWTDFISECLSFLTYGWSFHEIVYKRRMGKTTHPQTSSKYDDALIGWMKLPIRAQDTLVRWEYDDKDNLIAMVQQPPPDLAEYTIPLKKALLFRTESAKDNPEGRSILRNAYRSWYFKRRIQEIEAVGIERDLAGFPVIYGPEGVDVWSNDPDMHDRYARLVAMVKNIRRDEYEGAVLPNGYKLELLSTGGSRQFDTNQIIERYDTRIAMTVLADFLMLGHEQVGSFALSSNKTEMFGTAIGAFMDAICEVFNNQGIPRLIDMNGDHFSGITDYPHMIHGDVEDVDINTLATFVNTMVGAGVIVPDASLEDAMRETANLPPRIDENDPEEPSEPRRRQMDAEEGKDGQNAPEEGTPEEDDDDVVEEAKRRLGRS